MSWDIESFRSKVEQQHQFPGEYSFKFIVPQAKKQDVLDLLPKGKLTFRDSSNGKYVSVTLKAQLQSSQEVLDVYIAANHIEGCIAL